MTEDWRLKGGLAAVHATLRVKERRNDTRLSELVTPPRAGSHGHRQRAGTSGARQDFSARGMNHLTDQGQWQGQEAWTILESCLTCIHRAAPLIGFPSNPWRGSATHSHSSSSQGLSSGSSRLTRSPQSWIGIFVLTTARAGSHPTWRVAFLSFCFSFQQTVISLLACAPLLCGAVAGAAARSRFRSSLPWSPPALLFLFLSVICACCSFVTAIKLPCSFLPRLLATFPSPGLPLPREQPCPCLPCSAGTCAQPRPNLPLFGPLPIRWSQSPLWIIAVSAQDLLGHLWHPLHSGDPWSLLPTASKAAALLMPCHLIWWPRVRQARRVKACTLPHSLLLKRKTLLRSFHDFLVLAEVPEPTVSEWVGNFRSVFLSALK